PLPRLLNQQSSFDRTDLSPFDRTQKSSFENYTTVNVIRLEDRALASFDGQVDSSSAPTPSPREFHDETIPHESAMSANFRSMCGPHRGQP
ncbi:MAG: hypothetical protein ABMA26_19400, partial [Limisphaerales bacterium]